MVEVRDPGLGSMAHVYIEFVWGSRFSKCLLQMVDNLENKREEYQ